MIKIWKVLIFFLKDGTEIRRNSYHGLENKLEILRFLLGTSLRRDGLDVGD